MMEEILSETGLLGTLSTIRGFVLEHELPTQPIKEGGFHINIFSCEGRFLGSQSIDYSEFNQPKQFLEKMPEAQAQEERESYILELEQTEAQLLGWLLNHYEVSTFLANNNKLALSRIERLGVSLTTLDNYLLKPSEIASLPASVIQLFRRAGLSRKQCSLLIQEGYEFWSGLPHKTETQVQDNAIVYYASERLEVRRHILEGNIRLVAFMAKRYRRGMDFDSSLRAGIAGFNRALDSFESDRGVKLSTYAIWWIQQFIVRAVINHGRPVRIPFHVEESIAPFIRELKDCWEPGIPIEKALEFVRERLGLSGEEIKFLQKIVNSTTPSMRTLSSVNQPIEEQVFDLVATPSLVLSGLSALQDASELLERILSRLALDKAETETQKYKDNRAIDVLLRRLGVGLPSCQTLDSIGQHYQVTRERIRQIEIKVFDLVRRRHGGDITTCLQQALGGLYGES